MSNATANTIYADNNVGIQLERPAASGTSLKPGMLVRNVAGEFNVHNVSGGVGIAQIVLEDRHSGDAASGGGTLATYPVGSPVFVDVPPPGAARNVLLKASENVAVGDFLISGGDGTFIKTTGTPARTFCQAEEASNVGTTNLIKARFL